MHRLPSRWALLIFAISALALYGIDYQGQRTGYRHAASIASQNRADAERVYREKRAAEKQAAALQAIAAERKRVAGERAETDETTRDSPYYISSETETREAMADFSKAGGFIVPKRMFAVAGQRI